jgi:diguanylate cyclase (GGDEF)-like protein
MTYGTAAVTESQASADAAIARLRALAAGFREHAGNELRRMQQRLADPATVDAGLGELSPLLHRLAGSGGTFGFDGLARRTRALQHALRNADNAPALPLGAILAALADAARDLALAPLPHADPELAAARALSLPAAPAVDVHLLSGDDVLGAALGAQLLPFGYRTLRFAAVDAMASAWSDVLPAAVIVDLGSGRGVDRVAAAIASLREGHPPLPLFCLSSDSTFATRLAAARLDAWSLHPAPVEAMRLVERLDASRRTQTRPRRALMVDDDPVLGGRYAGELERHGFEVCVLADPANVLQALESFHPDIAVFDMDMPACSGIELARVVRMHGDWLALPILCLAAAGDLDTRLVAAAEGLDDVLDKPISGAALAAALHGRCERARVLAGLMQRDSLTGLLNQARIKEQLADEVARCRRSGGSLSVAMLDIDRFKQVNDRYGHAVGDRVIRALSQVLRQRVRQHDSVGRYGGEEFLLLLPDCLPGAAAAIVEDIRQHFAGIAFTERGETFHVTLSAGIVGDDPTLGAQDLLVQSDRAMYSAKQDGRNRVVVG